MSPKRKTIVSAVMLCGCIGTLVALAAPGDGFRLSAAPDTGGDLKKAAQPSAEGGLAGQPCGDGLLSQSNSMTIAAQHTVQCINAAGIPTTNGLARTFTIASDTSVCGVEFGVESNNEVGSWPVEVNLYEGDITGAVANLELRASKTVVIPANVTQQHFNAIFDEPVAFEAGEQLVVELFFESRVIAQGGDGGKLYLGSNAQGQSAPSYIRAETCNLPNFISYAAAGAPNVHLVMQVFTGDFGETPGACCIEAAEPECPADLTGTGSVGVPDLLELLSQWGPCPAPPSACTADLTGTGSVGVPDLLELLSQWGPCPSGLGGTSCQELTVQECSSAGGFYYGAGTDCPSPAECPEPIGACCFGGGACEVMPGDACAAEGGTYNGDGASCQSTICDLGPACPDGASDEGETCGGDVNGGCEAPGGPAYMPIACGESVCGSAWADTNQRDTDWYTITVTEESELTWTVESPFLAQIAILNDQCGEDLEVLASGETAPGSGITTATACVTPGTYRLFVAVDSFNNHACGSGVNNYIASLTCEGCTLPEPEGATCDDAVPLAIDEVAFANNVGNDWKLDLYCDTFIEPESGVVWFEVIGDGNELTAFNANEPGTVFQTQMYVYCGSCEEQQCIGQEVSHPNQGAAYRWCSEKGQTYYLAVWGIIGNEGDISMSVTSGNACEAEPCDAAGLCAGLCGGQHPLGCFCDDTCHLLGDCCPGICTECPEAAGCVHECTGLCGQQAPSGCLCGGNCELLGNCCDDFCEVCPTEPPCLDATCEGICGGGFPEGCDELGNCACYCDDLCWDFGDCCSDLCDHCESEFCP